MSGSSSISTLFQSEKYKGDENRNLKTRAELTEGEQLLIDVTRHEIGILKEEINQKYSKCGSGCGLGELRPHIPHIAGTMKEVGGRGPDAIPNAINQGREHYKAFEILLQNKKDFLKTAVSTLVKVGMGALIFWLAQGFLQQLKMGM